MCSAGEKTVSLTRLFHGSDAWLDGESGLGNRYTLWRASSAGGRAISDAVASWKRLLADRGMLLVKGSSETRQTLQGSRLCSGSEMRLTRAAIPLATQRRGREEEEVGIAQLLLRYGVAADKATADRQAATRSLSLMSAARVERNLEALRFLGWDTQQVSPATIRLAGPCLIARTAFCRAHGCALLTLAVCCTVACCSAALLPGLQVDAPKFQPQSPGFLQSPTCNPPSCVHGRSKTMTLATMTLACVYSVGIDAVSMHALLLTPPVKLAGKLGVQEDFGAFCAGRGKADISELQAEVDAHRLARQHAALD